MYTLTNAINNATNDAIEKNSNGLLIPSVLWDCDKFGDDCETVYSLISLYSDDDNNDGTWEKSIEEALFELFPSHF